MEAESRGGEAEALTQQPAGKQETTFVVAKEKATAMVTENAALPPSWDLVTTALGLAAEALAALKAALVAAMVLAAEAAAALKADDANGGNSGIAIVSSASLVTRGGIIK